MDTQARPDERKHCVLCHELFPSDERIPFQGYWVCARCKPTVVQAAESGIPIESRVVARFHKMVVACSSVIFPPRCVTCNAPARPRTTKVELRKAGIFRYRHFVVEISYCRTHLLRRFRDLIICVFSIFAGVALFVKGLKTDVDFGVMATGTLIAMGGGYYGARTTGTLRLKKVRDGMLFLTGAGKPFLDSLPDWERLRR